MARPRGINVIKCRLFLDRSALEKAVAVVQNLRPGTSLSRYVSEALRRYNAAQWRHGSATGHKLAAGDHRAA